MLEYLPILGPALVVCLLLAVTHCYLGIHVLMREVIFVDLALAQIAALGAAVGTLVGIHADDNLSYMSSLTFTLIGAGIFAVGRFSDKRVPQEAVIGIVFAVSSAVTILIISQSAVDGDRVEELLTGRLLYVQWQEIAATAAVYVVIFALHAYCWRPFFAISRAGTRGSLPPSARAWDFLFYATFGVVVTLSVRMAGVLTVFSFLIIPAACAAMFFGGLRNRLLVGLGLGLLGSFAGLMASLQWDWPTGESVVTSFGFMFLLCGLIYAALRTWHRSADPAEGETERPDVPPLVDAPRKVDSDPVGTDSPR